MKTMLLATAVLIEIDRHIENGLDFNILDVYTSLLIDAADGKIALKNTGQTEHGISIVPYSGVRDVIEEFYTHGFLELERSLNGRYRSKSRPISPSPSVPESAVAPSAAKTTQPSGDLLHDIRGYIERKLANQELPTLKSTQSRLKNYSGVTTREIEDYCRELGYKVTPRQGLKPSLAIIYKGK